MKIHLLGRQIDPADRSPVCATPLRNVKVPESAVRSVRELSASARAARARDCSRRATPAETITGDLPVARRTEPRPSRL